MRSCLIQSPNIVTMHSRQVSSRRRQLSLRRKLQVVLFHSVLLLSPTFCSVCVVTPRAWSLAGVRAEVFFKIIPRNQEQMDNITAFMTYANLQVDKFLSAEERR